MQATALTGFLLTQDQVALFAVSSAFGLGLSGLLPAYVIVIRECYTAEEANWRVPTVLFAGLLGMAAGGWSAGALYDHFGYYLPAFAVGLAFNLLNLSVLLFLVVRQRWPRPVRASGSRSQYRRGVPTSITKPTWSRRWCASSASTGCRSRRSIVARRRADRCSRRSSSARARLSARSPRAI